MHVKSKRFVKEVVASASSFRAKKIACFLVLAGFGLLEGNILSAPTKISVAPFVEVIEARVVLAQILHCRELPAELRQRIEKRVVTSSPSPGQSKSICAAEIERQLELAGISSDKYLLALPSEVVIKRKAQEVSAAEITEHVVREYVSRLPWKDVALEKLDVAEGISLPWGKTEWSFNLAANTDLAKPFYLNINIDVEGEIVKRLFLRTILVIRESVPIVINELKPSQFVKPEDIRWEVQRIASSIHVPVPDMRYFEGKKPRLVIGPGKVLTKDLFMPVPMIQRGDSIQLVLENDQMRLSTQAKSLTTGFLGQRIQVMNPDSGKVLSAEVLSPGRARLVF